MLSNDQYSISSASQRPDFKLQSILQRLSIKALRSAQNVLNQTLVASIQRSYIEYAEHSFNIANFLQFFLFSLINEVQKLKSLVGVQRVHLQNNALQEDYYILQNYVQKSQAEIRNHIRIEQQLKIYLENLQEKNNELSSKLQNQEIKYSQLFQAMRQIQKERKQLQKKVVRNDDVKQRNRHNSNFTTINELAYSTGLRPKGSKSKTIERSNDKPQRTSQKRNDNNTNNTLLIEGPIQINLSNNIIVNKKNSIDKNYRKEHNKSNQSSIRQMTQTFQMKHIFAPNDKRPYRKVSKYKTQNGDETSKKQYRSNSICN